MSSPEEGPTALGDTACLFCAIAEGKLPAEVVLDEANVLAFRDLRPQAPVHVLVIPKVHVASLAALESSHLEVAASLLIAASAVARQEGLDAGYRVVVNTGVDGGQTVDHLHLHVLGGRHLRWPPG